MTGSTGMGRAFTWVLGGLAAVLAVALIVVLTHRPSSGVDPRASALTPVAASSGPATGSEPSVAVSDPAADPGPSGLPSSEVQDHGDASPGATPYSQTDTARRQWQPVATGFGRAFTSTAGKSPRQWRTGLTPYVTDDVADQLATVDPDNVPQGRFAGLEVAEHGEDKIAVYLHYDTGLTLVAYLIDDGTCWRLYAYDRWDD